jgi:hypothetical protein
MTPAPPTALAALARNHLRFFSYVPPHGGHGGDWDSLLAEAPYVDSGERDRILAIVGLGSASPTAGASDLGAVVVDGVRLMVTVRPAGHDPSGVVEFMIGLYVTAPNIAAAQRLEAWFAARGLVLSAAR